jgi:hypothetical protein
MRQAPQGPVIVKSIQTNTIIGHFLTAFCRKKNSERGKIKQTGMLFAELTCAQLGFD